MQIVIYSDGSSNGRTGGVGGWAFVVLVDGVKIHEQNGSEDKATNNSVEIKGAIEGLKYADSFLTSNPPPTGTLREVILRSDSQLVLGYASGGYRCKAMHLLPLCLQLRRLYSKLGAKGEWVKGHSGDKYNDECDHLAKKAREDVKQVNPVNGGSVQGLKKAPSKISWDQE